jgi:CBS domain-containing protein
MDKECVFIDAQTTKWEAVRIIAKNNTILPIVEDKKTKKLAGIMTGQSVLAQLQQALIELDAEEAKNAS